MRTKHVLILSTIVLLGQGLVLLISPVRVFSLLGIQSSNGLLMQLFGLALLAFALVNWLNRNQEESRLQSMVVGNFLYYTFGFIVLLTKGLQGISNPFIWISLVLFFVMAVLFSYLFACLLIWNHLHRQLP